MCKTVNHCCCSCRQSQPTCWQESQHSYTWIRNFPAKFQLFRMYGQVIAKKLYLTSFFLWCIYLMDFTQLWFFFHHLIIVTCTVFGHSHIVKLTETTISPFLHMEPTISSTKILLGSDTSFIFITCLVQEPLWSCGECCRTKFLPQKTRKNSTVYT